MTLKELQEKKNRLANRMKELGDKFNKHNADVTDDQAKTWPDPGDAKNWREVNKDYDAVVEQIGNIRDAQDVTNRIRDLEADQNAIDPHDPIRRNAANPGNGSGGRRQDPSRERMELMRNVALQGWCRNQLLGNSTDEQREACQQVGLSPTAEFIDFNLQPNLHALSRRYGATPQNLRADFAQRILNAPLETGTATAGGNTVVPETLLNTLTVNMLAYGSVRRLAQTIQTSSGGEFSWPTADDTGNEATIIAENTNADNAGAGGPNPTFGKLTLGAYKYRSGAILVPYELIEDTAVNLIQFIAEILGERIGRGTNRKQTVGTGTGENTGFLTAASLGVTAASATTISADEVIELEHSIDPAYRERGSYMCHDDVILILRLLKDGEGNFLWQPSYQTGRPDVLAGKQIEVNQHMPQPTTGNKSLSFGDMSKVKIRTVNSVRMYRLSERYRENDQDGFMAFYREDSGVLDAGTPPIKYLQQA